MVKLNLLGVQASASRSHNDVAGRWLEGAGVLLEISS